MVTQETYDKAVDQTIEILKRDMLQKLEDEMLRDASPQSVPSKPDKLRDAAARVKSYFMTLWDALRGVEPYERDDQDEY